MNHSVDSVVEKLKELAENLSLGQLKVSSIDQNAEIIRDLGFDSLDYATLFLQAEQWLGVKARENEINWSEIKTLQQLAAFLSKQ